jgi:coatomer subunit beta'
LISGDFELAERSFKKGEDLNSLYLFYSSYGDEEGLREVCEKATEKGKYNVAF